MGSLVTAAQAADYLGGIEVDQALTDLVDRAEALFNAECGREGRPFAPELTAQVERLDGNGRAKIWLPYPIKTLTSVKLGYDSTNPDETLSVADRTKTVWDVGSRWIARVDGGVFGYPGQPSYVQVTYDTAEDLPSDAGLAVLRAVDLLYAQIGSVDAASEAVGGYRADLAKALEGDPVWMRAVAMHRTIGV